MKKPSVTQLIGMLDKPALLHWANKQGLLGINIAEERKRTKDAGLSMHEQIQNRKFADPIHAANYEKFLKDKQVLRSEGSIETEWFVGRFDAKMLWNRLTYIVDYKRSSGVYFENKLQLAAYGMGESADRFAIVHAPDFILTEANIGEDRSKYEDILIALSKIYTLRKRIEEERP